MCVLLPAPKPSCPAGDGASGQAWGDVGFPEKLWKLQGQVVQGLQQAGPVGGVLPMAEGETE